MAQAARKTILVVDDEADVRRFLKTALEEAGFEVMTAGDGFEALERLKEKTPDLISMDLVMPRRSGVMLYRDLIKSREWSRIPVIIVTGHARDEVGRADIRELTISGPGIYLEKPVRPQDYIESIKNILARPKHKRHA
jgi:CheY-like chemotaxis protein